MQPTKPQATQVDSLVSESGRGFAPISMSRAGRKELQFDYIGPDPYEDNIFYFSQVLQPRSHTTTVVTTRARTHTVTCNQARSHECKHSPKPSNMHAVESNTCHCTDVRVNLCRGERRLRSATGSKNGSCGASGSGFGSHVLLGRMALRRSGGDSGEEA